MIFAENLERSLVSKLKHRHLETKRVTHSGDPGGINLLYLQTGGQYSRDVVGVLVKDKQIISVSVYQEGFLKLHRFDGTPDFGFR